MSVAPAPVPSLSGRLVLWVREFYTRIVETPMFERAVVAGFALYALITAVAFVVTVATYRHLTTSELPVSAIGVGSLIATAVADAMIVFGIVLLFRMRQAPLAAFRWFQRAVLVSILVGEFFAFYNEQLTAVLGLAANLIVLAVVDYLIRQERVRETAKARRA